LLKSFLERPPREASSPSRREGLDTITDNRIGNGHLVIQGKSGDKRSRGRCTYLWRIASEDYHDIFVSKFEGSEDTAQGTFSRMEVRHGTIDTRQARQVCNVSSNSNDF
jgi:hypothetical protein